MISKRVVLIAISNRQCYMNNLGKITSPMQCQPHLSRSYASDGFFSKVVNRVTGKSKKKTEDDDIHEQIEKESQSSESIVADLEEYQKLQEAERIERIEKARLKSRLFYSDQALLHDRMPQAGIEWEKNDEHRSNKFKANMLAKYGKQTGIDPSVAWPTKEYIEEQREYESVLYDGKTLKEMIEIVEKSEKEKQDAINRTEEEIRAKMAKQEAEIKAWQRRVESRNVVADRERQKRRQILDELREEYGYEINPNDPQFASRIEEKEKEIMKAKKLEKKAKKKEINDAFEAKQKQQKDTANDKTTEEQAAS